MYKKVPKIKKKLGVWHLNTFFLLGGCEFEQTNLGVGGGRGGGGRGVGGGCQRFKLIDA